MKLNIFYQEPDFDRWLPYDRYPRQLIRRIIRGKSRPGGQTRVFLNLCAGLDSIGVNYRINDYSYIQANPNELACIIGKPFVLDKIPWKNPILFGASIFSHPLADPNLLTRLPIKKVLVPGEWMRKMFQPYWGDMVATWPVGIDTDQWNVDPSINKDFDFLIYDKIRWERGFYENTLLNPIRRTLNSRGLSSTELRYGFYKEEDFSSILHRCKAMIFLCEHETQGIAYQQALASGIPILAWDRGGFWQDPEYYPNFVTHGPVSSVPYWDSRCGMKFEGISEFPAQLEKFLSELTGPKFNPRKYILENLTLHHGAKSYLKFVQEVMHS